MRFTGVILDMDGTLLDSNEAHAQTWWRAANAHGFKTKLEKVRKLIGMGGDHLVPALLDISADSDQGKAVAVLKDKIFKEDYLPFLRPFPRARDLVKAIAAKGAAIAIASSSDEEDLRKFLDIVGIREWIDDSTSATDAEKSKPDPDIVQAAMGKLRRPADEILMIGDTPYDVAAARKSGIPIIALRCGGRSDEDLAGSLAIYDDPAALLEVLPTLPISAPFASSPEGPSL